MFHSYRLDSCTALLGMQGIMGGSRRENNGEGNCNCVSCGGLLGEFGAERAKKCLG